MFTFESHAYAMSEQISRRRDAETYAKARADAHSVIEILRLNGGSFPGVSLAAQYGVVYIG